MGATTAYTYDKKDRTTSVVDPVGNTVSTEYDANGNVSAVTDGLGNTTRYGYDALNRQTTANDALNKTTTTAYDNVGNIASVTDPLNNKTSFTYDELNRRKTETNLPLNRTRSYTYDPVGNLLTAKDGNNRTRKFVYDPLNRPKEEQWLNSANTPIRTISNTYDAAGQLKTINDPDASYALTYDVAGNLETVDNAGTPNVPNVLLKYAYNNVNNPISVTDTINGQLRGTKSFTYDDANRVTRITQSGNGVSSKRVDMGYDAAGQVKDVTRYSDLSGTGLVAKSEYVYDRGGRLTQLSHGKDNSTLANYTWSYDSGNRVTGVTSPLGSSNYSYDKRDQLTGANYSSGSNESYSYDDNGTRNSSGYQTGSNNQLQSDGVYNYQYDGEGNLTKRTDIVTGEVTEYSWDYRNRLTQVLGKNGAGSVIKSAQYTYDGLNRRIVKEVDADGAGSAVPQFERLVYDGQQIALTFDGSGNQTHRYLYGVQTDQILADEGAGGGVLWPLTDNLGTVRDLVDSNGVIQNRIGYDSFGKVTAQTNPSVGFRFGFTGRELDAETGNYYYNSRYYDPKAGRFISEDTVGFAGGDANLYRYVGNSPTNYTDPSGEFIPTAIPVAAPAGGLIPFLRLLPGVGGAGILLAPPGGGGLLNPLPAGQDDQLFKDRVRRGLIRPQGQTQPTPGLKTPPTRPSQSPTPTPTPAPKSAPKSAPAAKKKGSNCLSCDDPPFSSYDKCSDLVTNDLPFGGYKDTTINSAVQAMQNFRGKHPLIKDYRELEHQDGKGDPADKFKCKNPTGANHYNVYIKDLLPKKSAGSIAECKCCKEGNPPELVNRFAVLNIKDKYNPPNKYYTTGR